MEKVEKEEVKALTKLFNSPETKKKPKSTLSELFKTFMRG